MRKEESADRLLMMRIKSQGRWTLRPVCFMAVAMAVVPMAAMAQRYAFKSYLQEEGLGNLVVMSLLQDSTGFIWVGTQNGLFRYDGGGFKRFGAEEGLPSTRIFSLHETADGILWAGTEFGVARRMGDRFAAADIGGLARVSSITSTKDGMVFAATTRGLMAGAGEPGGQVRFSAMNSAPSHSVHMDPAGVLWFGCGQQLCRMQDGEVATWPLIARASGEVIRERWDAILTDRAGLLWLRSSTRLLALTPGSRRHVDEVGGLAESTLFGGLYLSRDGTLWAPTDRGLARRTREGWESIGTKHGLTSGFVSSVLQDREGSLWIGMRGAGVARWLGRDLWQNWGEREGLSNDSVRAIRRDSKGAIWIGTDYGLNRMRKGEATWKVWTAREGLPGNAMRGMAEGPDGAMWTGGYPGGLVRIDPVSDAIRTYGSKEGLASSRITGLLFDNERRLWVAADDGLFRSTPVGSVRRFERVAPAGQTGVIFHRSHFDDAGRFWVASSRGLFRLESGKWTLFTSRDGLKVDAISYLTAAPDGAIWIGYTEALGASRLVIRGDKLDAKHFTSRNGLRSDKILSLTYDVRGWLWFGTDRGVDVLDGSRWRHYGYSDGLVWDSCNGNAFFADADGSVWIGTGRGLSRFMPSRDSAPVPPTVILTGARFGATPADLSGPLEVPFRDRAVTFKIAALTFLNEQDVRFSCRLEGLESGWTETDLREIRYPGLAPGDYKFQALARSAAGVWSPAPVEVPFRILSPWWRTWPFVFSAVVFLLAAAWKISQAFSVRHFRQREALEVAVFARTRELLEEKARTEREKAKVEEQNREIARLLKEAEQASRLKSEFLANMSHEIRTPMNGVVGMTSLLLESGLTAAQQELAGTISHSADALLAILNDILDFSKIEAGKLAIEIAPFNLRLLAEEVTEMLALRSNEKGLDLILRYDPEAPQEFQGDAGRIRQVVINLVGNALKFTDAGHVLIEVECLERAGGDALMRLSVQDTGSGIPAAKTDLIFEKFTQADASTKRKYGGTGLGLAISKKLVELMGGTIGLTSEPDLGSTFWVEIRLAVEPAEECSPAAVDISGLRVLVVDDNAVNRRVLEEQLLRWKLDALCVPSAPDALRALREASLGGSPFRIGIIDHQMPGMDGEALGLAIQAEPSLRGTIGLILLSSSGQWATKGQLVAAGFAASLVKPARQSQLLDGICTAWVGLTGTDKRGKADLPAAAIGPEIPVAEPISGMCRARVLVAEDNLVNQKVAVMMLERLGCQVAIADNGRQAIDMLEGGGYDLVFMDCQMPELDGFEATAEIRRRFGREIPIIAMTANAMEGDRERCLAAGMDDYISKPVKPVNLKAALDRWLVKSAV